MGDFSVHGKIHKGLYLPQSWQSMIDCVRSTQMSISLSIFTVKSVFMKFMMLILAAWRRPILTCSLWERFGVINVGGRSNTGCLYSCCHCSYCRMCRGTASSATCVKRELKSCYCLTGASVFWLIRKNKAQPYSLTQTHLHTLNALAMSNDCRCMGSAQEIVKQWQQMIAYYFASCQLMLHKFRRRNNNLLVKISNNQSSISAKRYFQQPLVSQKW